MGYYEPRDFVTLPLMLEYLYERRESLLRPGLSLAMQPQGRIHGIVSLPGHSGRGYYEMRHSGIRDDLSTAVSRDGSGNSDPELFYSASAHLPFGFRVARSASPRHTVVPVFRPEPPSRADPAVRPVGSFPDMAPMEFSVPRHGFDQHTIGMFIEAMISPVLSHENDVCARELQRFGFYDKDYIYADRHTLSHLRSFVESLNSNYAPFMRLDTAFIGNELFSALIGDPVGTPTQGTADTVDLGGVRVMGHELVSNEEMFVMSHTHGPIFVNGPTTLTCTEDEFIVGRYCQVVSPQGGLSGRTPYGIRAGVRT